MPPKEFILYWSGLELYEGCPQRYLWRYGSPGIDLGAGLGRPKPKPEKSSEHHALMGIVIQRVIELMYNEEIWRDFPNLASNLLTLLDKEFRWEIQKSYIDWTKAPTKEILYETCVNGVNGFLKTMKHNKLLGTYAQAEVNMIGMLKDTYMIGGKADLIIERADTGVTILDGKNSQHKGKYTNPDQLRWYALCYYILNQKLPDRLGFVYYRYPYDAATGESGVDWVEYTMDDLEGLAARAITVCEGVKAQAFEPTPVAKNCTFCDWESVCEARKNQKEANSAKRSAHKIGSKKKKKDEDLDMSQGFFTLDIKRDTKDPEEV